jgi:YD repeat-containing protein
MVLPKGVTAGVTCTSSNPTFTYQYTTNAFGDILTTTDPLGHQSSRVYDKDRNVTSATDLDGNQTGYGYNFDSELIQTTRADTTTVKSDYWGDGTRNRRPTARTRPRTTPTTRSRPPVTDPSTGRPATYDPVGNLVAKQDPGGNCGAVPKVACTTYGYDKANQRTATTYPTASPLNVTYAYDPDGQRTSMVDGTGTSTWAYDSLHRLTSYKNGANATVGYGYDLRNDVTSIVYPASTGTVTRGYDDAGRLHSVTDWASHQTTFGYDADSFLTTQTYPNTTTATYTPDNADRLTGITDKKSSTTFASFVYTLDNNAQVTGVTSTGVPSDNHTYSYNQLNHQDRRQPKLRLRRGRQPHRVARDEPDVRHRQRSHRRGATDHDGRDTDERRQQR